MTRFSCTYLGLALLVAPVLNAQPESSIRANIRGGGGDGKCTFEVIVDGVAEVQIRGDQGSLRTLEGAPARWVRLDCNQPFPSNPADFSFRGVDGRGRQTLVRDPRGNRGVAVIRIQDTQGGSEGYTGDIMWRGGNGGGDWGPGGSGGPGGGGYGGGYGRPPRPGDDWGGAGGGGWNGQNGRTLSFRGDGNGFLARRGSQNIRVRDVYVNLRRNGDLDLSFEVQRFGQLAFRGRATRFGRDSIEADLSGGDPGSRASATIFVDPGGNVERIDMGGRMQGDDFRLNWRSH
jgi:hypothetical protein